MRTTLRYFALLATIASATSFAFAQDDAPQAGRSEANQTTQREGAQREGARREGAQRAEAGRAAAGQPGQARPGGAIGGQPGARAAQGPGMSVTSFFAHCLRRGNEAEVELSKLASEKAQNEDVKQFAQMMVEHHTQMIQKLQPFEAQGQGAQGQAIPGQPLPGQGAARESGLRQRVGQSEPDSQDQAARDDRPNNRRGQSNVRNSESGTDGELRPEGAPAAGGASQATTTAGQTPGTTVPGTPRTTAGQAIAGQAVPGQAVPGQARGGMMGGQVPHQVIAILDQKGDIELQMTKEMLQEHEGQDFEMGYLGQQILAHTCMLAELQALKNSGPQELQQLVTEGEQVAREHLDKAKQLAKQLKDKGDSTESPTRSARTPSTQPSSSQPEKK